MPDCHVDGERSLIEACIRKEPGAWERFVAKYRRTIRASVDETRRKFFVMDVDTDDLESYVYEKLLENECRRLRACRFEARFATYLTVVTRNLVRDFCSSFRTHTVRTDEFLQVVERLQPFCNPLEELEWEAIRLQAIHSALGAISDKQATIVKLRLNGKTLKEIAELTNRPMGTISVENSRALDRIRHHVSWRLAAPVYRSS